MKKAITAMAAAVAIFSANAAETPVFPGGQEALDAYITENLKYPPLAMRHGIEGNVNISFMVETDGSISSIKIERMIDPDLEAEAIRLVNNMPAWQPADANGAPVAAPVSIVIPFRLD